ncbi:hypothetical protein ABTZ58_36080 [Streptomyces sp. NPDC094143]|uniref:hypothetical protein n=1 Tax=Streptomyces sp. NPDC094143 TaxID=3155310 RepID=UPI00332315E4
MEMWVVIGGFAAVFVLYAAIQWAIDVRRERDHGSNSHWMTPVDPADHGGGASGQTAFMDAGGGGCAGSRS